MKYFKYFISVQSITSTNELSVQIENYVKTNRRKSRVRKWRSSNGQTRIGREFIHGKLLRQGFNFEIS